MKACAVDIAELEGDELTGGDVCQEYKVPSPIIKARRAGVGSAKDGGSIANVGHLYAFGNTEGYYRVKILGVKARGREGRDRPFSHATGRGWVRGKKGAYYDALRNKKATVISMIVESFGGNCVDIALAQHDVVGAVHLDLIAVFRIEQHLVASFDVADIGTGRNDLGPGQALPDLCRGRAEDAAATATLALGVAEFHQDAVVQHLDGQTIVVERSVLAGHGG